jgi:hypothetical protein
MFPQNIMFQHKDQKEFDLMQFLDPRLKPKVVLIFPAAAADTAVLRRNIVFDFLNFKSQYMGPAMYASVHITTVPVCFKIAWIHRTYCTDVRYCAASYSTAAVEKKSNNSSLQYALLACVGYRCCQSSTPIPIHCSGVHQN